MSRQDQPKDPGNYLLPEPCSSDRAILETIESPALESLVARLDAIPELENLISSAIDPDVYQVITEGTSFELVFDETLGPVPFGHERGD